jgi:hypothetical protein
LIQAGSATLAGTLVISLDSSSIYDGMTITLLTANNITGTWDKVIVESSTDCKDYQLDVVYSQLNAIATVKETDLCSSHRIAVAASLFF